jgi:hypothetical protein
LGQKYNYFVWTNRLSAEFRETSKNREGGRGRQRERERGEAMVVGEPEDDDDDSEEDEEGVEEEGLPSSSEDDEDHLAQLLVRGKRTRTPNTRFFNDNFA